MLLMHQLVWENCLKTIKAALPEQSFKTWFEPIKAVRLEDNVLTIQVPNKFFFEWIEEHYLDTLRTCIKHELGKGGRLEYFIPMEKQTRTSATDPNLPKTVDASQIINPFVIPGIKKVKFESNLHEAYTMENYVEGDCNKLARSAGLAIAKKPGGTAFNPLFIYGSVGLGKTHLIQAIGNEILKHHSEKGVLYLSSEKFTQQVIHAIKNNSIDDFMAFFQNVEVLLLDDIQFLANRVKTQEIFFHIFNQMHQIGKQIIISSDRAPKDLQGMEERLISRFKWGLSADLQAPDFETMMAILEHKSKAAGISFSQDVKHYICDNIRHNIRELEGVIVNLIAHASLTRKEVDIELAQKVIYNVVAHTGSVITLDHIKKCVADHYEVPIDKLKSQTRKRNVVLARQLSMYFAKNITNHSLKAIGDSFGGRDHSTVIYSVRAVNDMIDTDAEFKRTVKDIEKKLRQPVG